MENISKARIHTKTKYLIYVEQNSIAQNKLQDELAQNNPLTLRLEDRNLSGIDLSREKHLTYLDLSDNNIGKIDISSLRNLRVLKMSNNKLGGINL